MPRTHVAFYAEADGEAPVVNWLRHLVETNEKAWANCRARIEFWPNLGMSCGALQRIICGTGFMNCGPNKAVSNIESCIFSTRARLPYLHTA